MTRALRVVDSADLRGTLAALQDALAGGDALLPAIGGAAPDVPGRVEQRVALVVETSGSTARPKRVALSADAVLASAAAAEGALGGPGQWLLMLPANYIAGVNVLARSITAGADPVLLDDFSAHGGRNAAAAATSDVAAFADAVAAMAGPVRYTAMVPVQLARLIQDDDALEPLRRFDRILVGGQATPVDLLARALELGLNVTRTYGAAETCGGCVWDGVPLADALVRVDAGTARVELGGPTLAEGYLDDPAGTAGAFHHDDGHRWFRTDDRGEIDARGELRVLGRLDDVIVSGGVKVSLGEVEAVVRSLPGQEGAIAVAIPSQWGQTPVVVTEAEVDLDLVRRAVGSQLGAQARPVRVVLVDRMPTTRTGKPDRLAAAALAQR